MNKREEILIQAAKIIEEEGTQSLTIEYLADKCSMTKGGVLYHFTSKKNLIIEMNKMIIKKIDKKLKQYQTNLSGNYIFARAYAKVTIYYLRHSEQAFLPALLMTALEDDDCFKLWKNTVSRWEQSFEYDEGNARKVLQLRLICDGVWFSIMYNDKNELKQNMEKQILFHYDHLEAEV